MGFKKLKPCARQKLWRWNCLQFLKPTNLKLIPSQSWGTPKAESFSNWDLRKLKHSKGWKFIPTECWDAELKSFFQFRRFKQWFVPSRTLKHFTSWNLLQWRASPKLTSSDVWRCTPAQSWATLWVSKIKERLPNMSLFIPVITCQKVRLQKQTSPAHFFWMLDARNLFLPKVGHFARFSYSISSASWGLIISSRKVETLPTLIVSPSSNSRTQLAHVFH